MAAAPAARGRLRRARSRAPTCLGEGLRAHAAAAPRRARARQARRRRARCAGCCARRASSARTCTSTWSRWTRATRCWSWCSSCSPRRSSARGRRAGMVLQAYLRDSPETLDAIQAWTDGRGRRPHHAADRAPGQGRLLGPRDRRGPPARLGRPGVRRQGRLGPQLRAAHPRGCSTRAPRLRPARGDRLPQPALDRPRDRLQPPHRRRGRRPRAADPARPRRPAAGGDRRHGPARARLLPGRRPRGRHGLPRAPAAREHLQRLLPGRPGARRVARGAAGAPGRAP